MKCLAIDSSPVLVPLRFDAEIVLLKTKEVPVADPLSQFAATTSAQLAGVISDRFILDMFC